MASSALSVRLRVVKIQNTALVVDNLICLFFENCLAAHLQNYKRKIGIGCSVRGNLAQVSTRFGPCVVDRTDDR